MKYSFFVVIIILLFESYCYSDSDSGDTTAVSKYKIPHFILTKIDSLIIDQISINSFQTDIPGDSSSTSVTSEDVFRSRLDILDKESPINLAYNDVVKEYIDQYLAKKTDLISKMLGTSQMYFPLFEEMLDKYDLPLELKYLAIVESALNPLARSKSGAMGLWQFMFNTGSMLGLNITSYVDERRDPMKSTEAACKYLEFLYSTFGDWQLALAAYNGGPSVVKNAIVRSGGLTDYWSLRPYLPVETRGYVPAFIAVNYMMNYAKEHNIRSIDPNYVYFQFDTVIVNKPVSFVTLSSELGVPLTTIKFLNPSFKQNYIPESSLPYPLLLPVNKIEDYLKIEKNYNGIVESADIKTDEVEEQCKLTHVVKSGEYLHLVALEYSCSIENIRTWNSLKTDNLSTGQMLTIYVPRKHAYRYSNIPEAKKTEQVKDQYIYYTFQEGENVEDILNRLSNISIQEVLLLNNIESTTSIKAGNKIKIGLKN